jgi:hypothetical protein
MLLLYYTYQIKGNDVDGACSTHGRGQKGVKRFDGKTLRKRPLGRTKRRWMGSEWILRRLAGSVCGVD